MKSASKAAYPSPVQHTVLIDQNRKSEDETFS
eukprot:CAMPEP_0194440694 /NCGR_PEP_ID=MMETSP0176-20130528/117261_1 /TAXON_ID=216777 /ORGANISM="Proboscia alata, Strain PI-D3" /LENGTH=31 /DNA_ID= /DNA_START= /DNA_END= /DNA_ORIENTATION=